MTTQYVRTSVDLPVEEHRRLKAYTASIGITLKEYMIQCIDARKVADMMKIEESSDDDELVVCENYEDFLQKTGLRNWQ